MSCRSSGRNTFSSIDSYGCHQRITIIIIRWQAFWINFILFWRCYTIGEDLSFIFDQSQHKIRLLIYGCKIWEEDLSLRVLSFEDENYVKLQEFINVDHKLNHIPDNNLRQIGFLHHLYNNHMNTFPNACFLNQRSVHSPCYGYKRIWLTAVTCILLALNNHHAFNRISVQLSCILYQISEASLTVPIFEKVIPISFSLFFEESPVGTGRNRWCFMLIFLSSILFLITSEIFSKSGLMLPDVWKILTGGLFQISCFWRSVICILLLEIFSFIIFTYFWD